jgi:hypothetical protein
MELQDIEQAYLRLLTRFKDLHPSNSPAAERRSHPRFVVNKPHITVRSEFRVPALDVSISGISFRSPLRFEVGRCFTIQVGSAISGGARVVACEPDPCESANGVSQYRIRCTFSEETIGMPMVVVLNDHVPPPPCEQSES